ncbi:40S ribosomal protein S3aE [Scheffersomyces coipomensis]|uniref:40S ribosomal protein S3aE n=1 Tax=Scheffersomyces coipomensis TaxID=1788519 RepID=UPI00315CF4C3
MAIGKNQKAKWKVSKNVQKALRDAKKITAFSKKDWVTVRAPRYFKNTHIGKTPFNRGFHSEKHLKGRVFEVNLADLEGREDLSGKVFKFDISEIRNNIALTSFKGMRFTAQVLSAMIKKKIELVEGSVTVKTADGFSLRVFVLGIPRWRKSKGNAHAKSALIKKSRMRILEIIKDNVMNATIEQLILKLIPFPDVISSEILKTTKSILPLSMVHITKIKVVKSPPLSIEGLLTTHRGYDAKDLGKELAFKDVILDSV